MLNVHQANLASTTKMDSRIVLKVIVMKCLPKHVQQMMRMVMKFPRFVAWTILRINPCAI